MSSPPLPYLRGYPEETIQQVQALLASGELERRLVGRYPDPPVITTDAQLYRYVGELKGQFLRRSAPLSKVCFSDKLRASGMLGTHTFVSRVQGAKTKAKNELRIAGLFRTTPPEFLHMVVVHELAHLKEKDHNRAFYQLCRHMEPNYHQYEMDLRLYLTVFGDAPRAR